MHFTHLHVKPCCRKQALKERNLRPNHAKLVPCLQASHEQMRVAALGRNIGSRTNNNQRVLARERLHSAHNRYYGTAHHTLHVHDMPVLIAPAVAAQACCCTPSPSLRTTATRHMTSTLFLLVARSLPMTTS